MQALALGLQAEELNARALDLLETTASKLRSDTVDDVYLAIRFASLLETHVQVLRRRFARENGLAHGASRIIISSSHKGRAIAGRLRVLRTVHLQRRLARTTRRCAFPLLLRRHVWTQHV